MGVIVIRSLQELTRFIWQMSNSAK